MDILKFSETNYPINLSNFFQNQPAKLFAFNFYFPTFEETDQY